VQLEILALTHVTPIASVQAGSAKQDAALRAAAEKLEAGFLAEMLKSAGMGQTGSNFGGGAGEDQFASFLVQEHALMMTKAGGIGLAEAIFESLKKNSND
jgi:Rod binding domain-containing protein